MALRLEQIWSGLAALIMVSSFLHISAKAALVLSQRGWYLLGMDTPLVWNRSSDA